MTILERHPLPWKPYLDIRQGWIVRDANDKDVVLKDRADVEFISDCVNYMATEFKREPIS